MIQEEYTRAAVLRLARRVKELEEQLISIKAEAAAANANAKRSYERSVAILKAANARATS